MNRRQFLLGSAAAVAPGCGPTGPQLLNASYDATRELYRRLNKLFADRRPGVRVRPSHGGSGSQARAVIDGLPADVLTLALWPDTDAVRRAGLIDPGWEVRFPHRSCPYTSTIVFVVRRGNPHHIRDWEDVAARDGVRVVTANPKTSGAAKLGLLACWGAVTTRGGSAGDAEALVRAVYRKVPALEGSSRAASVTFARKLLGDVQLTWENEARLEADESRGALEVVYPTRSILAEPHVAVVDGNARRAGAEALADEYLRFLYTPAAQEVIAGQHLRPTAAPAGGRLPDVPRFGVDQVAAGGWPEAQARFFADGGVFDRVYTG